MEYCGFGDYVGTPGLELCLENRQFQGLMLQGGAARGRSGVFWGDCQEKTDMG